MKDFFKNRCDIVRDLLPLYADESCSKATSDGIAAHLVSCRDCRSYLGEIRSYHEEEVTEEIPDSDPDFAEVLRKLRKRKIIRRSIVATAIITSVAINAVLLLTDD